MISCRSGFEAGLEVGGWRFGKWDWDLMKFESLVNQV